MSQTDVGISRCWLLDFHFGDLRPKHFSTFNRLDPDPFPAQNYFPPQTTFSLSPFFGVQAQLGSNVQTGDRRPFHQDWGFVGQMCCEASPESQQLIAPTS